MTPTHRGSGRDHTRRDPVSRVESVRGEEPSPFRGVPGLHDPLVEFEENGVVKSGLLRFGRPRRGVGRGHVSSPLVSATVRPVRSSGTRKRSSLGRVSTPDDVGWTIWTYLGTRLGGSR